MRRIRGFPFVDDCVTQQDGLYYKRRFLLDEECAASRRLQRVTIVRKIAAAAEREKKNGTDSQPSTGQEVCMFCVCACIYYIYI